MTDTKATGRRFDVVFTGRGTSTGKMRNDIAVTFETTGESFDLATDEGVFHGGDNSAPPPLALFTAALTGCIMTQIRAFSKRLGVPVRGCSVDARLHWQGQQEGAGAYVTAPVGFTLDIDLDTDADLDDQRRLIDAAKKGCFIEQTLAQGLTVAHRLRHADDWYDA